MASQTVMTLASSFTLKLATFNSPTPTLLPLPPRSFSCSSSLPTLHLKASYGGIRALNTFNFKCYAVSGDGKITTPGTPGLWDEIPNVEQNEEVQEQGKFAVDERNKKETTDIKFKRVFKAQMQLTDGINYNLWIQGEEGGVAKTYEAVVFIGPPVPPKELKSFVVFPPIA